MPTFGEKLRALRQGRGMKYRELADALNVPSHGYLADLEKGRRQPSLELAVKIAHYFGVSLDQLAHDDQELSG